MFYRDFYIQFCYLNNPNARDESNNRRYEQKEFLCDIFDKLDFKGLLSLDTVKFTVGEDLKDLSTTSLEGAIREYIDNNYPKLTEERENVANVVLLQYAQMMRDFGPVHEKTAFYCRDAQYRGTPLREQPCSFSVFHRSRLFCGLGMGTQIQELTKEINRVLKELSAATGRKN